MGVAALIGMKHGPGRPSPRRMNDGFGTTLWEGLNRPARPSQGAVRLWSQRPLRKGMLQSSPTMRPTRNLLPNPAGNPRTLLIWVAAFGMHRNGATSPRSARRFQSTLAKRMQAPSWGDPSCLRCGRSFDADGRDPDPRWPKPASARCHPLTLGQGNRSGATVLVYY